VNDSLLIDTDILIDCGRNDQAAIQRLTSEGKKYKLAISCITQMEMIVGCRNKTELKMLEKFLENFYIIEIGPDITSKAIELLKLYRLGHGLLIPDSLIAATAIILNSPLISKNQKDFRYIKELELMRYPS
jgi:predicted nucleic acid-binding protein